MDLCLKRGKRLNYCPNPIRNGKVSLINRNDQDFAFSFQYKQHQGIDPRVTQEGEQHLTALTHKSMELFGLGMTLKRKPSTRAGCGDLLRVNHFPTPALQSSDSSHSALRH